MPIIIAAKQRKRKKNKKKKKKKKKKKITHDFKRNLLLRHFFAFSNNEEGNENEPEISSSSSSTASLADIITSDGYGHDSIVMTEKFPHISETEEEEAAEEMIHGFNENGRGRAAAVTSTLGADEHSRSVSASADGRKTSRTSGVLRDESPSHSSTFEVTCNNDGITLK